MEPCLDQLKPQIDYQRYLDEGRFMLQRSRTTGKFVFYPRVAEPRTGSIDLEWIEATGRGCIYSTTIVRKAPPTEPYNVVLVDLEEGVRMMSRVEGIAPDDVKIGMAVQASVVREGDKGVVVFRPAAS
jgi:uncharacterized OB-fold protein